MTGCEGKPGCPNSVVGPLSSPRLCDVNPWAPTTLELCAECVDEFHRWQRRVEPRHYVAIGGARRSVDSDTDLGRGGRVLPRRRGLRRAAWDAAFGYVSGFRKRDIAYWVLTRSLSERLYWRVVLPVEAHYGSESARSLLKYPHGA